MEPEEPKPEPGNLKEAMGEILVEMTGLPLIGEPLAFILAFYPAALLYTSNQEFQFFSFNDSLEIIFFSLFVLFWVELIERWFELSLCIPYLPIPIKYACYLIIGVFALVEGIEALGLYHFG